jgi:RNA polymerase sigma factor (TIGR02999 family)
MPQATPKHVTQLLVDWSHGDQQAPDALIPLVYDELRRLARSHMRRERPGRTLQTTGLVHEAYLRLVDQKVNWQNRAHFFGIAAKMMRRVLLDGAKKRHRNKRGGGAEEVPIDEVVIAGEPADMSVLVLDEALGRLEKIDPQGAQIVELRYFGGLSNEEVSDVLRISPATVQRQWASARAWLRRELTRRG